jgi:hypothetical protein
MTKVHRNGDQLKIVGKYVVVYTVHPGDKSRERRRVQDRTASTWENSEENDGIQIFLWVKLPRNQWYGSGVNVSNSLGEVQHVYSTF